MLGSYWTGTINPPQVGKENRKKKGRGGSVGRDNEGKRGRVG